MSGKQVAIGGSLPSDLRENVMSGDAVIEVDKNIRQDLYQELEGKTKEELVKWIGARKDKTDLVYYNKSAGPEGKDQVYVTSKLAKSAAGKEQAIERITDLVGILAEESEEFSEKFGKAAIDKITAASCSSCRVNGIARNLLGAFIDFSHRNNLKVDYTAISEKMPRADALYFRAHSGASQVARRPVLSKAVEMRNLNVALPDNAGGARPSCADCFRKHIGKAIIQLEEALLGYPQHFWLAMANLSEAEAESITEWPTLAETVREVRLEMTEKRDYRPDLMQFFDMIDELTVNIENE